MKAFCAMLLALLVTGASAQKKEDVTGLIPVSQFWKDAQLKKWFAEEYDDYHPQEAVVNKLQSYLSDKRIVVVLGTWCSDTHTHFPHLIKVLDAVRFPKEHLTVYGVNEEKTVPKNIVMKYKITLVPTIILYNKAGKEKGRIEEEPKDRIELDLLNL